LLAAFPYFLLLDLRPPPLDFFLPPDRFLAAIAAPT
jgi:hypothetical protein